MTLASLPPTRAGEPVPEPSSLAISGQEKLDQWDAVMLEAWFELRQALVDEKITAFAIVEGEPTVTTTTATWSWAANDIFYRELGSRVRLQERILVGKSVDGQRIEGRPYIRRSDVWKYLDVEQGALQNDATRAVETITEAHEIERKKYKKDETKEERLARLSHAIGWLEAQSKMHVQRDLPRENYETWIGKIQNEQKLSKREAEFVWVEANLSPWFRGKPN